ncbi:hypothetical protein [Oribacterium sp. WCC10]|uniref:hypothetical protein n=1 Tax=Oribacterium sp. WCC10 TaxID=1855343 RepID=UPI0008E49EFB|nr:hypothetical protein [Oribacterium sp. WCC10]SFG63267.1 hypothetical protein SAMN05216356_1167 [Oribacterium sp. WCC10]
MKKLMMWVLMFTQLMLSTSTAMAAGNNSVTVTNIHNSKNQAIAGWNLSIYEVASYRETDASYVISDYFKELIDSDFIVKEQTANDISEKASEIEENIIRNNIPALATQASDENGSTSFSGLEEGLYIIIYSERSGYDALPSFVTVLDGESSSNILEAKIQDDHGHGGGNGGSDGTPPGENDDKDSPEENDGHVLGKDRDIPEIDKKMVLGKMRVPQTGDSSLMNMYLLIIVISISTLTVWSIVFFKKHRK